MLNFSNGSIFTLSFYVISFYLIHFLILYFLGDYVIFLVVTLVCNKCFNWVHLQKHYSASCMVQIPFNRIIPILPSHPYNIAVICYNHPVRCYCYYLKKLLFTPRIRKQKILFYFHIFLFWCFLSVDPSFWSISFSLFLKNFF